MFDNWPAQPKESMLLPPSTNLLKRELEEARGRKTVGLPALGRKVQHRLTSWLVPAMTPPPTVRVRLPSATLTQHVFSLAGVLSSEQWRTLEQEVASRLAATAAAGPVAAQVSITRTHVWRELLGYRTMWTDFSIGTDARVSSGCVGACLLDVLTRCGVRDAQDGLVGAVAH